MNLWLFSLFYTFQELSTLSPSSLSSPLPYEILQGIFYTHDNNWQLWTSGGIINTQDASKHNILKVSKDYVCFNTPSLECITVGEPFPPK